MLTIRWCRGFLWTTKGKYRFWVTYFCQPFFAYVHNLKFSEAKPIRMVFFLISKKMGQPLKKFKFGTNYLKILLPTVKIAEFRQKTGQNRVVKSPKLSRVSHVSSVKLSHFNNYIFFFYES